MSQIPTQSDFHQTTPLAFGQLDLKKEKTQKSADARKSQKSSGKIRRIHELVSLYRCKFKPNVSDASIIGTLHSAASVIQIHFRYRKHLREAQNVMPTAEGSSQRPSSAKKIQDSPDVREAEEQSSHRPDGQAASQDKKSAKKSTQGTKDAKKKQVIRESLAYHENFDGLLVDQSEGNAFKEVRGSVFGASEVDDQKEELAATSPKELKFKRDKVQLKQQNNKDRLSSKATRDYRRPNKLQLMLDIEQITNEHEQNTQNSAEPHGAS